MAITADTKDWTWVLERPCPECGFDASSAEPGRAGDEVRAMVPRWRVVLARPEVRDRPDESTWSPLEYGCHVRDVLELFAERLQLIREHHDPLFGNWDQDETAEQYGATDPGEVADQIETGAEHFAAEVAAVENWDRIGRRSNGSLFTASSLTRYGLHDLVHHLWDVRG